VITLEYSNQLSIMIEVLCRKKIE